MVVEKRKLFLGSIIADMWLMFFLSFAFWTVIVSFLFLSLTIGAVSGLVLGINDVVWGYVRYLKNEITLLEQELAKKPKNY